MYMQLKTTLCIKNKICIKFQKSVKTVSVKSMMLNEFMYQNNLWPIADPRPLASNCLTSLKLRYRDWTSLECGIWRWDKLVHTRVEINADNFDVPWAHIH